MSGPCLIYPRVTSRTQAATTALARDSGYVIRDRRMHHGHIGFGVDYPFNAVPINEMNLRHLRALPQSGRIGV